MKEPVADRNDPLTRQIIGAAIEVHRELGPGLLESAYQICLFHELQMQNHQVERELELPINYKGIRLDVGYRMDLLVDAQVVVELKTVAELLPIHEAQLLTYMRIGGFRRGLLLNFNCPVLRDGIKRMVF